MQPNLSPKPCIAAVLIALAVLACSTTRAAESDNRRRPNFVVVVADDMAWNDCGAYGHPSIRTPNIDRLAREGMRFDRAFLTCSSCSPSRASILTGRYPHATGAAELHQPLPADQILFAEALRKAGYYTAAVGKWHLGSAVMDQFDLVKQGGNQGLMGHWIPVLQERPKDKPFFLWLCSSDPHRPYRPNTIPEPHTAADAVVPPFLPDVAATRGDLAEYYDEVARLDTYLGKVLDELARQGVAKSTLVLFLSDNGRPFPRCKTTLYDSGVRTPFVVRWPEVVKPGTVSESLVSSVDIGPTLLQLAGLAPLPTFQGVSFAAILEDPTAEVRQNVFAEHNWHDYRAHKRSVRSDHLLYIENAVPEVPCTPPADAVRSPTFRAMRELRDAGELESYQRQCFRVPSPAEELYDLRKDPYALNNLADKSSHTDALAKMRNTLENWKRQTGDYLPEQLTPDKFDRETGEALPPR
jgi:arylsulfatase A-like enzyme